MITISNLGPHDNADHLGEHTYEIRIKDKVIATFKHRRSEGLSRCLVAASEAVDRAIWDLPMEKKDEYDVDGQELIRCWSCNGSGVAALAEHNTSGVDIVCGRCKGKGKCPAIMKQWCVIGDNYRKLRQKRDMSTREWAACFGVSCADVSDAENGRVDPRTVFTDKKLQELTRNI